MDPMGREEKGERRKERGERNCGTGNLEFVWTLVPGIWNLPNHELFDILRFLWYAFGKDLVSFFGDENIIFDTDADQEVKAIGGPELVAPAFAVTVGAHHNGSGPDRCCQHLPPARKDLLQILRQVQIADVNKQPYMVF